MCETVGLQFEICSSCSWKKEENQMPGSFKALSRCQHLAKFSPTRCKVCQLDLVVLVLSVPNPLRHFWQYLIGIWRTYNDCAIFNILNDCFVAIPSLILCRLWIPVQFNIEFFTFFYSQDEPVNHIIHPQTQARMDETWGPNELSKCKGGGCMVDRWVLQVCPDE